MKAKPIFDALAALTAVRELKPGEPVAGELWSRVMRAENTLRYELERAGLQVAVEMPEPQRVAA